MNNISFYKEDAIVLSNKRISSTMWESHLKSPKIAAICKPGQFINIIPNNEWNNVMRRPMSIASKKDNIISIIYKIIGNGTQNMSKWCINDKIDIIGPLGNNWMYSNDYYPVLIGGGTGTAPLLFFRDYLNKQNIDHSIIIGARTKDEHILDANISKNIYLTTDNGEVGIKGNVLDGLKSVLQKLDDIKIKIYSCGPEIMMLNLQKYCNNNNIMCELSLEGIMACGFGLCQGCTVIMNDINESKNSYRKKYKLMCVDGPVFNSRDVKFC